MIIFHSENSAELRMRRTDSERLLGIMANPVASPEECSSHERFCYRTCSVGCDAQDGRDVSRSSHVESRHMRSGHRGDFAIYHPESCGQAC